MMGIVLRDDCRIEDNNRPWKPAIATVGVPRMTPGDLLHHKFGTVDQRMTITGSHNWTDAANNGNDETVLVIHNATITAHYQREFERLYTNAILGVPPAIQKKVSHQIQQCQTQPSAPVQAHQVPSRPSIKITQTSKAAHAQIAARPPRRSTSTGTTVNQSTNHPGQRVNLNTATQAELEQLSGVGPSLAKRIMARREKRPFNSLNDLDQVSGVGPKLLQKLKDQVEW